jgi:hypothetical protein
MLFKQAIFNFFGRFFAVILGFAIDYMLRIVDLSVFRVILTDT